MTEAQIDQALARIGALEEELEATCAALATLSLAGDELGALAAEHREAAAKLRATRPRVWTALASAQATVRGLLASERAALAWLRGREHRLVRAYLALETSGGLSDVVRARVRRYLLPAAFDRLQRVDRLVEAAAVAGQPAAT